ncbi:hypothetical protein B0T18DRAFT_138881 [Schizothecium vesticola]|uniref:Uncharacterized protein n=1 Tax=Schizothecium vesticola TaxID=314040 RepID=A0AA40EUN4_9PEZI|nr:hypothetical protein B0T18DRAFT_138881 [Schizothecium vesticola]
MPAVIRETQPVPMSKKRRRDGDDNTTIHVQQPPYLPPTYQPPTHHFSPEDLFISPKQHPAPPARKILSPYCSKRQRLSPSDDTRRTTTSPGRQQQTAKRANTTRPSPPAATPKLNRCHICSRKPTKKSDLDSFADCEACGQRTCFVCIRQCLGWQRQQQQRKDEDDESRHHRMDEDDDGVASVLKLEGILGQGVAHKQVVCSGCCVERGVDGEVVCLGCLPYAEG